MKEMGKVPFGVPLQRGTFLERKNRFAAEVDIQGRKERVFVPNSGRMRELLLPGTPVWLAPAAADQRLTRYDLVLVQQGKRLVSIDSRMANNLLWHWLNLALLPEFTGYQAVKREVPYGASRLDFFLASSGKGCLVEAKSVTLVTGGQARFPDAPTERGARHLAELARAAGEGLRGAALFVIQREDAEVFRPNDETDPAFGRSLREAVASGVEAYAYSCRVSLEGIAMGSRIPVIL